MIPQARRLIVSFATAAAAITSGGALTGCASMKDTRPSDCMERTGSRFRIPFFDINNYEDKFSEQCAAARFGTIIAGMTKSDGSPDMTNYLVALSLYQQASPETKKFMDGMLKTDLNLTIDQIRFKVREANGDMDCLTTEVTRADGKKVMGVRCKVPTAPEGAASAPAAFKK